MDWTKLMDVGLKNIFNFIILLLFYIIFGFEVSCLLMLFLILIK